MFCLMKEKSMDTKLEAGVKSTTIRYNGLIHEFGLLNPLAEIPQVKDLFIQASAQLREYLK